MMSVFAFLADGTEDEELLALDFEDLADIVVVADE
jgi:hypothetical protein